MQWSPTDTGWHVDMGFALVNLACGGLRLALDQARLP